DRVDLAPAEGERDVVQRAGAGKVADHARCLEHRLHHGYPPRRRLTEMMPHRGDLVKSGHTRATWRRTARLVSSSSTSRGAASSVTRWSISSVGTVWTI